MSLPFSNASFVPMSSALAADPSAQFAAAAKALSKPVKRTCTVAGCTNGIVQGGLCVSHGAKRRQCMSPGCTKRSKAAGMCSKHGPKRKPCDEVGCTSISVRGTKCKVHAEPSKKCSVGGCRKAAVLGGVCKRHTEDVQEIVASGQALPAMPQSVLPFCMPTQVPVPTLSQALAQQSMLLSMGMAGLPYGYPTMFAAPNFLMGGAGLAGGLSGIGVGSFGRLGAMEYEAASLLASRRAAEERFSLNAPKRNVSGREE